MHIALQGCLKAKDVRYGLTPDTGGHIKYLLELAAAAERQTPTLRQQLIVRRFDDPGLGEIYGAPRERISDRTEIIRIDGATSGYVSKEDMRFELPVLADSLEAHIMAQDIKPDVLHGHYADGGMLAVEMKRRLGIPVMFTGHSLGRVKARTLTSGTGGADIGGVLKARIETEEQVIAAADRIVASSIDEAELQYGMYRENRPEAVRINPPGCDLEAFRAVSDTPARSTQTLSRFLKDTNKPTVLALARPVRKKNLAGLVRAFGEDPELRERANLVIYAGTRDKIGDEDAEARDVLTELFTLVDDYDLWGHVALPKTHEGSEVAKIYADARKSGGVFVNIALNEPFGLTLIEAAASGLPVVATNSGGPNDILYHCKNGALVDPSDTAEVGQAIRTLLEDRKLWEQCSQEGLARAGFYSWDRHAEEYLADVRHLCAQHDAPLALPENVSSLLVCDIDNTLTGDETALAQFSDWVQRNPGTAFGIATGRSLHSALEVIDEWHIPTPKFLITSVGSELYWVNGSLRALHRDPCWPGYVASSWRPAEIASQLSKFHWLAPQAEREQRRYKQSYFLKDHSRSQELREALTGQGLVYEMIYSHGQYLDFLPKNVSKGHAVQFVGRKLGVARENIWAAGDSGNDITMLRMSGKPIIVGNHSEELAPLRDLSGSYFARGSFAAGILEGLDHEWVEAAS